MNVREFLQTVITTKEGNFCLLVRASNENKAWEEWFHWPNDLDTIISRATELKETCNVYFSSYLFDAPISTKEHVIASKTIQADLDDADIDTLVLQPTILVETSPKRFQGYWILEEQPDKDTQEILSRKLTYSIPLCDRTGWSLGHRVRLPDTLNHKYLDGPKPVEVKVFSGKEYHIRQLELLPDIYKEAANIDNDWLNKLPIKLDIGPQELLESIRTKLPSKVYTQYNVEAKDRSRALWAFMCAAFRCGLTRDEVFWLAKHSANNKFTNLRYGSDKELGKDTLRAEQVVKSKASDVKSAIYEYRRSQGSPIEKRPVILMMVLEDMKVHGSFIRTNDDNIWYIRKDLGRPIAISKASEYLDMILDLQYGLNASETEQTYVTSGLAAYTRNLPATAITGALSYLDADTNSIMLHTGKKDIIRISKNHISTTTNGSYGVVFPWISSNEPFIPSYDILVEWEKEVYGPTIDNVLTLSNEEALAILKVWTLFLLIRNSVVSRPILAFFGQPGAGKSTLFRRVYALLYGRQRSLNAVTDPEDFDHSVSIDPLVVLDNVDSFASWLPDRLALSASTSDIVRRKLYTDVDTISLKRQALVGITAHNPKFGREDVADRLLLFNFERLSNFRPEGDIIDAIVDRRGILWGNIILDLQKILRQPMPTAQESPQFRVEDFARVGWRIAQAVGCSEPFVKGLGKINNSQKSFSLEEEYILVSAIQSYANRNNGKAEWKVPSALWTELEMASSDSSSFQKIYRNAIALHKKLWAMQTALKSMFDIECITDEETKIKKWRIKNKDA